MELPTTFVDFAVTEARFRKHFRKVPRDAWHENMILVSDYLDLDPDDRDGKVPYVWALDANRELSRLLVAQPMVESAAERRDFWLMLKDLAGDEEVTVAPVDTEIESRVRQEVVQKIASGLMGLVGNGQDGVAGDESTPCAE